MPATEPTYTTHHACTAYFLLHPSWKNERQSYNRFFRFLPAKPKNTTKNVNRKCEQKSFSRLLWLSDEQRHDLTDTTSSDHRLYSSNEARQHYGT